MPAIVTVPPSTGDENQGPLLLAIIWTECSIAILIVAARMFARVRLIHNLGLDDWIMLFTLIVSLVSTSLLTRGIMYGIGRHAYSLNAYEREMAYKLDFISQPFSIMSAGFGKVSISFLLLRTLVKDKARKYFLYGLMASLTTVNGVCVIVILVQCKPISAIWDPNVHGDCWSPTVERDYGYFQGPFSAVTDLILALFPVMLIWNLNMKRNLKIGLACAMSLGVFATIASAIKTYEIRHVTELDDYTYKTTGLIIWFSTENYVIIIAACIPTLRPLYTKIFGKNPKTSTSLYKRTWPYHRKHQNVSISDDHYLGILGRIERQEHLVQGSKGTSEETVSPMNGIRKTTDVDVKIDSSSLHGVDTGTGANMYLVHPSDRV